MFKPIAYIFQAAIYCPDCICNEVLSVAEYDGWQLAKGIVMDTESNLNEIAAAFGINRMDETTFDSGTFPKVTFSAEWLEDGKEYCGACDKEIS